MARTPKAENNIQVFRGSLTRPDVFAASASSGCCPTEATITYDKLAERTRFDNAQAHSNPLGANDKFSLPGNTGFSHQRSEIINHINEFGVGATISVLAVPTYAFVTGVAVHVYGAEEGLTFNLTTRNGLVLPADEVIQVVATQATGECEITRTQTLGSFDGIGVLDAEELFIDIFGRSGTGSFSLEADEIILEVATMPTGGTILGNFGIEVSVSYEVIKRAER